MALDWHIQMLYKIYFVCTHVQAKEYILLNKSSICFPSVVICLNLVVDQ
jgi:hypothetical protein